MKTVLLYLFACYLGIMGHIIYNQGLPSFFRDSDESRAKIVEQLSAVDEGQESLSKGFEKVIRAQKRREIIQESNVTRVESRVPALEGFEFLVETGEGADEFSNKLLEYATSEDARRETVQIDVLKQALLIDQEHPALLRISLHSFELLATSADEWREEDQEEIGELALELLKSQASDSYELERIKNNLRSIGIVFDP